MAVCFHDQKTGLWLTAISGTKAGDEVTLSVGRVVGGGEFTTFRLPEPVGQYDLDGSPTYNLRDAEMKLPHGEFMPCAEVEKLYENRPEEFEVNGHTYYRTAFGHYMLKR